MCVRRKKKFLTNNIFSLPQLTMVRKCDVGDAPRVQQSRRPRCTFNAVRLFTTHTHTHTSKCSGSGESRTMTGIALPSEYVRIFFLFFSPPLPLSFLQLYYIIVKSKCVCVCVYTPHCVAVSHTRIADRLPPI